MEARDIILAPVVTEKAVAALQMKKYTFRVRKDCSKVHDDADNGCTFHWGTDWPLHFRGEPLIPVSDGGSNMAPGAQITRA